MAPSEVCGSTFHGALQLHKRLVPLLSDRFQRAARLVQLGGLELPQSFASNLHVAYQTCGCEHPEVTDAPDKQS